MSRLINVRVSEGFCIILALSDKLRQSDPSGQLPSSPRHCKSHSTTRLAVSGSNITLSDSTPGIQPAASTVQNAHSEPIMPEEILGRCYRVRGCSSLEASRRASPRCGVPPPNPGRPPEPHAGARRRIERMRFPKFGGHEVSGVNSDQGVHRCLVPERRTRRSSSSRPSR